MNDLIQTGFDYGDLPADKVLECETAYQMACTIENQATRMIGEQFAKVKENVKSLRNGNGWREWCEKRLGISHTQAQNYINEFENGDFVKLFYKFGKTARWLLAAPNTPQEVRDQASALAEAGEDVSVKTIKQLKADYEAERLAREQADALWKETVAYHQKLAESTQNELALERQRSAEWKAQWKAERDKPAVEKVPADYDLLKQTERDLRNELANLKQQQRGLIQQQVVAKLKERESELAEIDQKVHDAESRLDGLRTQIDRYSMQERELKVHMEVIEKARTAIAVLAANMEGFDTVIDTDHELRRWRALADMMEQGAAAIRHFVGDAKPTLTIIAGSAA